MRPTCQTPGCLNLAAKYSPKAGGKFKRWCNSCCRKRIAAKGSCRWCDQLPLPGRRVCEFHRRKAAAKSRRYADRCRIRALRFYSGGEPECACCKERSLEFLALDHLNGGGLAHRRSSGIRRLAIWLVQRGFPSGFRVLCSNCNQSYGAYGYCPHENLPDEEKEARRSTKRASWFGSKDVTGLVDLPAIRSAGH